MNDNKKKDGKWYKARPFIYLIPAVLVAALVFGTLPFTAPVLKSIPEKMEFIAPVVAEAAQNEPETQDQKDAKDKEENGDIDNIPNYGYTDGVFTGSAQGYGGPVKVQVTVKDGRISEILILEAYGETEPYFTLARSVIDSVIRNQSWELDAVSGATYSSNGILGAVKNAITGETVVNEAPPETAAHAVDQESFAEPSAYKDGTYTGYAQGFGGTIAVQVTIVNGEISAISIIDASGETYEYFSRALSVIPAILNSGSPNVDTVSGATYSSAGIITAVKRALAGAAVNPDSVNSDDIKDYEPETKPSGAGQISGENKDQDSEDPMQNIGAGTVIKDGVYTAEGWCTDDEIFRYKLSVSVTIKDNKITAVDVIKGDDTSEEATPEQNEKYLSYAVEGRSVKNVNYKGIPDQIVESQKTVSVDIVSGATFSSNTIKKLAAQAISEAFGIEEEPAGTDQKSEAPSAQQPEETTPDPGIPDPMDNSGDDTVITDGTYSAEGWCSDNEIFKYLVRVAVTLKDGKITAVDVTRGTDESYDASPDQNDRYLSYAISGRTVRGITYKGIPEQIVETQKTISLDVVSGATYSSNTIRKLAAQAVSEALGSEEITEPEKEPEPETEPSSEPETEPSSESETDPQTDPGTSETDPAESSETGGNEDPTDETEPETPQNKYKDGTYSASAICDGWDVNFFYYEIAVSVTISDGRITTIKISKENDESDEPDDNYTYLSYAENGRSRFGRFYTGVTTQILEAQNAETVDAVSGATYSSRSIQEAVKAALAMAEN